MSETIIHMQSNACGCTLCGKPTEIRQGIAINQQGEIVGPEYQGTTAGRHVCRECYEEVQAGKITHIW